MTYGFSIASFICEAEDVCLVSGIYFETSALLITLIMMGRFMSDFACHRAVRFGSIRSLQTQSALLVDISDASIEKELEIDARLLQLGDTFRVKHGCFVATDGTVVSGVSESDESVLTGEASLVEKTVGSSVIAGSINFVNAVLVEVTRLPETTRLTRLRGWLRR